MAGKTVKELALEFGQLRKLRPQLGKAVAHIPLSAHPDDRALSDSELADIANQLAVGLGYEHCARVVVRHTDTDHQHAHLLICRIDTDGNAVSDAHDYRKAEQILRQIERDFGLHQVSVPGANAKKIPKKIIKETQMNQATMTSPEDVADTPIPMVMLDPLTRVEGNSAKKRKRDSKRSLTEPNYEQWIRSLFGDEIRSVYHHAGGTVIYFDRPQELRDEGHQVTARNMSVQDAAQKMVAIAVARAWTHISFTGSDDFVRAAVKQAMAKGLKVVPANVMQMGLIDEVRAECVGESILATMGREQANDSLLERLRKRRIAEGKLPPDSTPPSADQPARRFPRPR